MFGGAISASSAVEQGGVVTLGATVAAAFGDDTLGTVTITGLSSDLTQLQWRHLYVEHRHLDRHGGAVRCADVQGRRRRYVQPCDHGDHDRRREAGTTRRTTR